MSSVIEFLNDLDARTVQLRISTEDVEEFEDAVDVGNIYLNDNGNECDITEGPLMLQAVWKVGPVVVIVTVPTRAVYDLIEERTPEPARFMIERLKDRG